jgi:multidrug efflux pump subunit AcrB
MNGLIEFSVRRWQFTLLGILLLAAIGLVAWRDIPRSEDPELTVPTFSVVAILPGAPPVEVEALVAEPLEEHIRALEDLDRVRATVVDGAVSFNVEFELDADVQERHSALLREIEAARAELPDSVTQIEVRQQRPSEVAVLQYAVVSDVAPMAEMRRVAEAVESAALSVDGVRDTLIEALPEERVEVQVDPDVLTALKIPLGAVLGALTSNEARIPGGHVEQGDRRMSVTSETAYTELDDLRRVPVLHTGEEIVRLADVAVVERRHAEADHLARMDGRRAVWVGVQIEDGANLFEVRDAVVAAVGRLSTPDSVEVVLGFDQSENVARRLQGFGRDFAIAIVLVLVTLLPLGWRASTIVMTSIPLSLAVGVFALNMSGFSVNQLSIVGFVISLGLLVDDAIVVVENIARHLRLGRSPVEAAIEGTREISLAVLGCTATLLLAFLPLVFLPGTAGVFIRSLPAAVLFTVLASLFVSLFAVPLLASRWLRPEGEHGNAVLQWVQRGIEGPYRLVLDRAMVRPKTTLLLTGAFVAGSLLLLPVVGFSVFPKAGIPMFRVEIDTGEGASLATTDAVVRSVEEELRRHPEVIAVMADVGESHPRMYYNVVPKQPRASVGELFVRTDPHAHTQDELLAQLRAKFAAVPGATVRVKEFENGPPIDAPVAIRLVGDELGALRAASLTVEQELGQVEGLTELGNPLATPRTDLQVARAVRFGLAGLEVGQLREPDGTEVPIVARAGRDASPSVDQLRGLSVDAGDRVVPLGEVAAVELAGGPARITRQDGERTVTVSAGVRPGYNTAELTALVSDRVASLALPAGVRWELAGEAETQQESFGGVGTAALVAMFGILAVLVLEFRTFRGTLVVATVIPLGVAGGVWALLLTGNSLSFTAAVGFVALVGIEIKNSILLVDFTTQLRQQGLSIEAAVAKAGEIRFLPILLTTATALGGLLPLALEGSALYSPLAWVIIGGLVTSTALARIVTPVAYRLLAPPLEPEDAASALLVDGAPASA